MRDVNPVTIIGTLSWCKILPLHEFNVIRAKQKDFTGDGKEFAKVSRAVTQATSFFFLTNSLEFRKSCQDLS